LTQSFDLCTISDRATRTNHYETNRPILCDYRLTKGCATVPTPKMAVGIPFGEDSVKWTTQNFNADPNGFLMEFTPEGQQLKDWREMVAQQILFTRQSL